MRAIFLDRDGVINRKAPAGEYITNWQEIVFLPGVFEAAASLYQAGYLLFIVTNQRGVAIRKIRETDLDEIHRRMSKEFVDAGAPIAEIYCCAHDIGANCQCRKPRPGMLIQAAREYNLVLADCWIIGDSASDIQAGHAAGCKTAQIVQPPLRLPQISQPDITADSLRTVAMKMLKRDYNNH